MIALRNGGGAPGRRVIHDWVHLETAKMRLHHYRFRSRDWMLKVKACRGYALTGGVADPAETMKYLIVSVSFFFSCLRIAFS